MKSVWENPWFTIPVLVFFVVVLVLALVVPYGQEILFFNAWRFEPFNSLFNWSTLLGEWHAYVAAGLVGLFWRFRYVLLIGVAGLLTTPLTYVLKEQFNTDRPIRYFENQGQRDLVVVVPGVALNGGQTSFPSGHTTAAFTLYSLLASMSTRRKPVWGLGFAALAVLVGFSRIFLVQHFLADVVAGALLGLCIGWVVWQFDRLPWLRRWKGLERRLEIGK